MKTTCPLLLALLLLFQVPAPAANDPVPANPQIDYSGFLKDAAKVGELRNKQRITEAQFLRMATEPGTVILDARSADKYALLHVQGAVNLPLTDSTEESLAKVIPGKNTRILIYCNNNFGNEPQAFASKSVRASLNIYTFNTLYSYGYTQVYELGPFLDIAPSNLPLVGSKAASLKTSKKQ
jgi:hypothetical protein